MRLAVERLAAIFDSLDYHVALYDQEWRYTYVNAEAARVLGRSPEELVGQCIWDLFPDAVGNQYYREVHDVAATGRIIHSDHFYQPFDRWYENHIYPLPDGVMVLARDVTDVRRAAETLKQRETLLRLAQRAGGIGTFAWDFTARTSLCSPEFFALFGLPAEERRISMDEWEAFVHPDDRAALGAHLQRALAGQEPAAADYRIVLADGRVRWLSYAGQLHETATGERLMLGTVLDITERKAIEERLADANRLKDEFLATLSHELRTPLNVIRGRTSMLALAQDLNAVRQTAEIIDRNGVTLERLVGDLLDVSRITRGQVRLDCMLVDPASLVHAAVQTVQTAADAKRVELRLEVAAGLPALWADATRLQQVVWNLLINAVKFTPAGGRVDVRTHATASDVVLTVRDTGAGIPTDMLPHIFEMFRQVEPAGGRVAGGLGLGLSIARRLVELHGGDIRAESDGPERGAAFIVRLPIASAAQVQDAGAAANLG